MRPGAKRRLSGAAGQAKPALLRSSTMGLPVGIYDRNEDDMPEVNYHNLLQDFISYYGKNNSTFTEHQIKKFAEVVNIAIKAGSDLENAFVTCFLEHLGQIHARKPLYSYLSNAAKERLHA